MSQVTQLLQAIDGGDQKAASELLPLVYDELRQLAAQKLAKEKPGQTLQPTALVHEAYLRLVGPANADGFANRRHFVGAAAEAMRRILVDQARQKFSDKRGGQLRRHQVDHLALSISAPDTEILTIHDALDQFTLEHAIKAEVVKLHFFLGMTLDEVARTLDLAPATVDRYWVFARAWLKQRISEKDETD
jgi:RNA polymerase sigma factor (TIGR02999 family)